MGLRIVTEPTVEPITLADLRKHLGIEPYELDSAGEGTHPHDGMIMAMLTASRDFAEQFTGRSIALKTYQLSLDAFPDSTEIELPMPPLVSVESLTYVDTAVEEQSLTEADWVIDREQDAAGAGWVLPVSGTAWPSTAAVINAVQVQYRAGYQVPEPDSNAEDALALPGSLRAALLLMVGHLYENREAVSVKQAFEVPLAVESLLRPYRVRLGMA